jgi:hypothetical protein
LLRRCQAAFVIDSGVRHLANAACIPVVFARNLYFNKIEAGSYCEGETDISPDLERFQENETGEEPPTFDPIQAAAAIGRALAVHSR